MRKTIIKIMREYGVTYSSKTNTQKLIKKLKDSSSVDWINISRYQKLSEEFIREFPDKVYWYEVSQYQKLSEEFIREFQHEVGWSYISRYQKLSEDFIREFQDRVNWVCISAHQKLSEDFIREFQDNVAWVYISQYQKLSKEFIKEFKLTLPKNNWLYATKEEKLQYIKKNTQYEIIDNDYITAYKSVRSDNYSVYNFQYHYTVGNIYTSHCDCNLRNENSFGLSAWTVGKALEYHSQGKLLKVKIKVEDIGTIVHDCQKIRCSKLEVLEEL